MEIRIRETGAVVTDREFRQMHLNTSFPPALTESLLNDFGADVVYSAPMPVVTRYQTVYRNGAELIDGKWYAKYSVADLDAEAQAATDATQAAAVRATRNARLSATDWRFRSDMNPSQAWIDYCQALRDLPEQSGFPWDINWPSQPDFV